MKLIKNSRIFLITLSICFLLSACAHNGKPQTAGELKGMGMVVELDLAPDAAPKSGVIGITDAGNEAFGKSSLIRNAMSTSSIGGGTRMSFPRWVHVTWRENQDLIAGKYWTTGTVVGDYKVEVLSRIPEEIFNYVAAGRGRTIVLKFRIKDDGVLFAWAVRETSVHPTFESWVYKMEGGDFK